MFVKRILLLFLIIGVAENCLGQDVHKRLDKAIFGSFHLANYNDDNAFTQHVFIPGIAFEYRKKIDSLKLNFHITLGISLESVPLKRTWEGDGYQINTHFNFTIPIGFYYTFPRSYYVGIYSSLDIPFAVIQKTQQNGMTYQDSEFTFRLLNLNFSAGLNAGRIFTINERHLLVELHFKALGLLGLKSNDYWHYPSGSIPYYTGIRIGYGF